MTADTGAEIRDLLRRQAHTEVAAIAVTLQRTEATHPGTIRAIAGQPRPRRTRLLHRFGSCYHAHRLDLVDAGGWRLVYRDDSGALGSVEVWPMPGALASLTDIDRPA